MTVPAAGRRIFLRNHVAQVRIGIHDFERTGPQRLVFNVELFLEGSDGPRHDRLDEVVDYDFVRAEIAALAARGHWNLQESFVHAIVAACLARPGIAGVRVSSAKPDVYPDCEAVGYEVTQFKPNA